MSEPPRSLASAKNTDTHGSPVAKHCAYWKTLLVLALAAAGLGELDEADALGAAALESGPAVWPTMVLAGKLDRSLSGRTTGAKAGFRDRYIDAAGRRALPGGTGGAHDRR